jgi:hypothetical protein
MVTRQMAHHRKINFTYDLPRYSTFNNRSRDVGWIITAFHAAGVGVNTLFKSTSKGLVLTPRGTRRLGMQRR